MCCGWHILKKVMLYWKTCLTGIQVLLVGLLYRGHALKEGMFYRRICFIGGHIAQQYVLYRTQVLW